MAMIDCDEAIRIDPQFAFAYDTRGDVYFSMGDYDRAIADYESAIRIKPDHTIAIENLKKAQDAKSRQA